jgi:phosphoglycerate dehydrogenase-like enzyme
MSQVFRVGVTPDFYIEAKGRFEDVLERELSKIPGVEYEEMPPLPGNHATPDVLEHYDALFVLGTKIDAASVRGVNRLTCVARWGVGYNMIDTDALTDADMVLAITPRAVRRPVAEAIFTFIFALSKNLMAQDRIARAGKWRSELTTLGTNLPGRTLGSVGCGNIAQEMFRMGKCLGMGRLIACDPFVKQESVADLGIELVDMDTVFRESDFVTVNTFLNKDTEGLVGEQHFRLMKPAAFFINTARGPIVQHDALVKALREKWIAGAGIDVFPVEPPPKDDPLFELDNVIVAPHALAWTEELLRDNAIEACKNMLAVKNGEVPEGAVNRAVLTRPGFQKKLENYRRS